MKKLVLTSLCTLALAGAAFAQGNVNWGSVSPAAMTAQTNATVYSPLFGGGSATGTQGTMASATTGQQFYFTLLFNGVSVPVTGAGVAQPTTVAGLSAWNTTGLYATNGGTAGRLAPVSGTTAATVPWAAGVTQNVMLVGWSANLGTTWAAALNNLQTWDNTIPNAYFGMSTTGYIAANNSVPGATVFATGALAGVGLPINSLNTQLYLLPVPEPSTLALAGLGGLALLALRRRK
jgi:hypothetical protein